MGKKLVLFVGLFMLTISVRAQYVSLDASELDSLRKLFKTDGQASNFYTRAERRAKESLDDTPAPIPLITSQGLLMGDPNKMASLQALQDVDKIFSLALTAKISREPHYLEKCISFLLAWAKANNPDGNPINETKLEDMVFAYDLIRSDISEKDRMQIDSWLSRMREKEAQHISGRNGKGTSVNNWNTHRVKMMIMINYTLKDGKYDKHVEEQLVKQIANNLNADGSTYDFHERDALNYHIFSIEPFLKAITVLKRATGKDYFQVTSSGGSIKKGVDFLVPYMEGVKKHKEFLNSKVEFDRKRARNNEKGFQVNDFVPGRGIPALSPAVYFDRSYLDVIDKAKAGTEPYFDWQILLARVRKHVES
jgi:hypothetical protein